MVNPQYFSKEWSPGQIGWSVRIFGMGTGFWNGVWIIEMQNQIQHKIFLNPGYVVWRIFVMIHEYLFELCLEYLFELCLEYGSPYCNEM